ncbi:CG3552 [Drosophila busckii]|uniref:GDP-D-glucose phosphorylase 1 n=1 Tax=Drosophila busckii TaxID=30019 RepID=A0A0M4EY76_DROBS|nr:GDP-D-glucose phosphorylase 1 [Drosophila busckii]ALC43412.1 CG3552 [Drosophila busckii]
MILRTFRQIQNYSRYFAQLLAHNFKFTTAKLIVSNRQCRNLAALLTIVAAAEPNRKNRRRSISKAKYNMSLEGKAHHYLNSLKVRWMQLHEIPGLFAYQLPDTKPNRLLRGKHGFYAELNENRTLKRRAPQTIENLNPTFKPKAFNFNKVDALEVMMTIDKEKDNAEVQMIINKSPITKYHTLVCPDVKSNLVQRITPESLSFCVRFMRSIKDPAMRLGYNSPGALASVNHLHYHLLQIHQELYIDRVKLEPLAGGYAYRLSQDSPTEAICFVIERKDDEEQVREKIQTIYKLTECLCNNNLPHNVFMTRHRQTDNLQVFVFVRQKYCVNKDLADFNVGFCELVGYLPMGDPQRLERITETDVLERIRDITGSAYKDIYQLVQHLVSGTIDSYFQLPFTI